MIVSKDISPEQDVYFIGAKIIDIISRETGDADFFDVYKQVHASGGVSMSLYTLSLDWLYIAGVIDNSENGNLRKCF